MFKKFKYATREHLLADMQRANNPRDYEFNSFEIKYPTRLLKYAIEFDKDTKVFYDNFQTRCIKNNNIFWQGTKPYKKMY